MGAKDALDELRAAHRDAVALGHGDQSSLLSSQLSNSLWWMDGPISALQVCEESIARSDRRGLVANAMLDRAETLWMVL